MPIFARTKLLIQDDCLKEAPGSALPAVPFLTMKYTGPNPQKLYDKIKEIFSTVLKYTPDELQERDFKWDRSAAAEKFSVTFEFTRDMDRFSYIVLTITLKGEAKPSKDFGKEGTASIRMDGKLRTEYPQDTLWQRSLLYEMGRVFYHRIIYEEKRKQYKLQCKDWIYRVYEEIKSFLNIIPSLK